jgi:TPR repeat protein
MVRNALLLVALFCSLSWTAGAQDLEKIDLCDERISQSKRSDNPNHTLRNWVLDQNQYCMGARAYERGDYAAALSKIRPLAERGHAKAQNALAFYYANGHGVPLDHAEAVKWYRKAAEQGHSKSQSNLGQLYLQGQGVRQDYAEAAKWFRKAAEQGLALAQYNLGVAFNEGRGLPQNQRLAVEWWSKAGEQGHPQALINLGVFAWRGTVIPQSFEAAYTVWGLAFKAGAVTVQAALEEASKKLTSEQLQRAKRTIEKEWKRMQARKK